MPRNPKEHPRVNGDHNVVIGIPAGPVKKFANGTSSHYLWIARGVEHIGAIESRRELKKLRTLINKILGE